ncbi:hypothetical protein LTR92_007662 [Exophiala xenobiotica]|nr:hypothetical protein LTR92_007662 [Exophiala xenobiotica]
MVQKSSSIQIPKYAPDPLGHYWDNITTPNAPTVVGNIYTNAMGDFSFYPVIAFGGRILTTASSATSVSPTMIQTHPKYDNTRYSFSGRSYGVGSSAGLVRSVSEIPNLARYSYLEPGYKTSVSCTVNESSLFNIWPMFGSGYKGVPVDYLAVGPLPNMLVSNVRNAYQNTGVKNTNSSNTVVNQMGISEAFQSILDDILLGQSGAQFMLAPNGKQTAEVTAKVHALRIGQNIYIYGIAALNFLLLLVLSIEAARLKLWKYLPHFNYNDPTNLIIAASLGGCTIAEKALKDNYQHERSERAGNLEIQLELRKDESAALVAAINPTEPESTPLVRIIVNQ